MKKTAVLLAVLFMAGEPMPAQQGHATLERVEQADFDATYGGYAPACLDAGAYIIVLDSAGRAQTLPTAILDSDDGETTIRLRLEPAPESVAWEPFTVPAGQTCFSIVAMNARVRIFRVHVEIEW